MAGKLITLPLRVSIAYARFVTRVAGGAAERALSLAGRTVAVVAPARSPAYHAPANTEPQREPRNVPEPAQADPRARRPGRPRVQEPAAPPTPRRRPAPEPPPVPTVQEPAHVSAEPELVREEAE